MAAFQAAGRERPDPRISANDLARYMVSSATTQLSIVRRAKFPQTPPVTAYRDARQAIGTFLADPGRSQRTLAQACDMLDQKAGDSSLSHHAREEAKRSKAAIEALMRAYNALGLGRFELVPGPRGLGALDLEGVAVSVNLDLMAHASRNGVDSVGGVLLRLTQPEDSDSAKAKRKEMALYAATLAFMQVADKKPGGREPAARLSLSIDVQSQEVFMAPGSNTRRISDLKSACRMIAAVWDGIEE